MSSITSLRDGCKTAPPRRTAPFDLEPGFYEPANLWLYGNTRLLESNLVCIPETFGHDCHSPSDLDEIERKTEQLVLDGQILVTGIHNSAHQRAAVVPLRWGAPRIVIFSGGFFHHLGKELNQEPFRTARLWRYEWDRNTDLGVSRRAPEKLPTYAKHNPSVDRLIDQIACGKVNGLLFDRTNSLVIAK